MFTFAPDPARTALRVAALTALIALVLLTASGTADAVPVDPTQRLELRQPDGSTFEARPFGDEWYHGFETAAGYTVVRDDQTWEYAQPKGDKLVPSGLVAGDDRPTGLDKHLRDETRARPHSAPARSPQPANIGTQRSLVILVQFADQRSLGTTPAQWSSRFFGASDSVRDYYDEVSYGALDILPAGETHGAAGDGVVGWLTLPSNHPRGDGTAHRSTVRDAIVAASPFVDFRSFDRNGDGELEPHELHVTVIPAGWEESRHCGTPAVWGHWWVTANLTPTVDGVRVGENGYTMFGEQHCDAGTPARMATLGIIVHEIGHDLDLPDLYDVDRSSNTSDWGGVGFWSVMAAGSWLALPGSPPGSHPPHPDAFSKAYEGWIEPRPVSGNAPATELAQAATSASVVRMRDNPGGVDWTFQSATGTGEYYLLENRQRVGYDRALPGCGVLIWHIDESRSATTPNADDTRRLVQLEEADGNRRPFDAGDAFVGAARFTGSRLYDGSASGVSAANFSAACAATMSVDLATGAAPTGPANDAFASSSPISRLPFAAELDTRDATVESGEPAPSCAPIGRTAWFRFTPSRSMRLRAHTLGSGFDTVLAVHRGNALGSLTEAACSDDVDRAARNLLSSVEFDAVAGQTYQFQVGGFRNGAGTVAAGPLRLALADVTTGGGDGGGGDGGGGDGGGGDGGDGGDPPDACASRPGPARASLDRRRTVRVSSHGRFRYSFAGAPGLAARVAFAGTGMRATGSFTLPAGGRMAVRVKLGRSTLRALRRHGRVRARATVTLGDSCGRTSTASRRFVLKR